jgi:hypothetical protein
MKDSSRANLVTRQLTMILPLKERNTPKEVILSHLEITSSGVGGVLTGNPWPPERCHRTWAAQPPATSKRELVTSSLSANSSERSTWRCRCELTRTCQVQDERSDIVRLSNAVMNYHQENTIPLQTFIASTSSCGHTVCVMAVPALGPMTLERMLYFLPSIPSVFPRPIRPALAVAY